MVEGLALEDDKPREHCGIIGIIDLNNNEAVKRGVALLNTQRHRGFDAGGILTQNHGFHCYKGLGRVEDIFTSELIAEQNLEGPLVIGHRRYRLQGGSTLPFVQPLLVFNEGRSLGLGHNGNIPPENLQQVRQYFIDKGVTVTPDFDSNYLAHLILYADGSNWIEKVQNGIQGIEGSYALVLATDDGHLMGVRDPWGNRPLSMAEIDGGYAIASESVAFPIVKGRNIYELKPGEIVDISPNGAYHSSLLDEAVRGGRCVFERIYFAYETSMMDEETISTFRKRLGRKLAQTHPGFGEVVSGVPKTAIVAANAFAHEEGKPAEGLVLKRDLSIGRSFMAGEMPNRIAEIEAKFDISPDIEGRAVELVDDSVICGNTLKVLLSNLRTDYDVPEIHVRSTAPKVVEDCSWGVNMRDVDGEFVAVDPVSGEIRSNQEIAKEIGATTIDYLSMEELKEVVSEGGMNPADYCYKCLGGEGLAPLKLRVSRPVVEKLVLPVSRRNLVFATPPSKF